MKLKILLGLLVLIALANSCREKEKINSYSIYVKVGDDVKNYPNSEVTIYKSEIDFWAGKSEVMKGLADNKGEFYIQKNQPQPDNTSYWFKVTYNGQNNYRYGKIKMISEYEKFEMSSTLTTYTRTASIILATTPTKLQLRVFNNGVPILGAKVYLYDSENYYNTKNNYEFRLFRDYSSGQENNKHFYVLTDENGISTISNLEPKQYWFRIEKDGKSNASSKIVADGALPDDINITTILDVAIN